MEQGCQSSEVEIVAIAGEVVEDLLDLVAVPELLGD